MVEFDDSPNLPFPRLSRLFHNVYSPVNSLLRVRMQDLGPSGSTIASEEVRTGRPFCCNKDLSLLDFDFDP